ncbi:MAG: GNAT family N-acetyltransferase [Myxococcales bacterium]|nr:GNAT family N-acetyltransferase [Myxococcales bacterium]
MSPANAQVSATISTTTKEKLDRFTEELGLNQQAQGAGIGRHLLRHVFTVALHQRTTAGCLGVVTDAKPGAVAFCEKLGFVPLDGVREGRLHGDPLPMFLDLRSVAAADRA